MYKRVGGVINVYVSLQNHKHKHAHHSFARLLT